MSAPPERDECVTTEAAHALGKSVPAFLAWAHRHGLRPVRRERVGTSTYAVWNLDAVYLTHRDREPTRRPSTSPRQ